MERIAPRATRSSAHTVSYLALATLHLFTLALCLSLSVTWHGGCRCNGAAQTGILAKIRLDWGSALRVLFDVNAAVSAGAPPLLRCAGISKLHEITTLLLLPYLVPLFPVTLLGLWRLLHAPWLKTRSAPLPRSPRRPSPTDESAPNAPNSLTSTFHPHVDIVPSSRVNARPSPS